jgi:hypothetical protein
LIGGLILYFSLTFLFGFHSHRVLDLVEYCSHGKTIPTVSLAEGSLDPRGGGDERGEELGERWQGERGMRERKEWDEGAVLHFFDFSMPYTN